MGLGQLPRHTGTPPAPPHALPAAPGVTPACLPGAGPLCPSQAWECLPGEGLPPLCPRITHSTGSGCERGGWRGPYGGRQVPTGGGSSSPRRARGPPRKWRCCPGSSVQPPQAPGGRPGRCPWPCAQLTSLLLKYLRAPSRSVSTNFRLKNCPLSRPRFQRKPSRYPGGEGPCRTAATLTRQRPGWTLFPSPGDPQPPGAGRPAGVSGHQPVLGPQATPSPPGCTLRPFVFSFSWQV